MKTLKGPGIFLAQFLSDSEPYNDLLSISKWANSIGFKGVQVPTTDPNIFDLKKAAESKDYAQEVQGKLREVGIEISELSTHLQGQLIAVHPTYDQLFDGFAPVEYRNNPKARTQWATEQLFYAARASANLGLTEHATFSGALLWHMVYPWPQRPSGLVETGFKELASRWLPILNEFEKYGVDLCYEIHPGEDLHDGVSYERFLEATGNHNRACLLYDPSHLLLQGIDYLSYIDHYHERIKMFHVKDAEFNPDGKQGVYGGYSNWVERAGRFRSLGDGQVDFKAIFSKLAAYDFQGWAVMEWECALKNSEVGAIEGAKFIKEHIIPVTEKAFDDFAATGADEEFNRKILGI
ncbi:MAG: sugar phosphate isomerase/epimerase family protein [Sphingobacterium sp.]